MERAAQPTGPVTGRGWTRLRRGLAGRCPLCGADHVFRSWGEMRRACPGCGFRFEREPGYWVGAMIIDTAVTFAALFVVLVGGILLTWPDVPWGWLAAATAAVTVVVGVAFYPRSKTLWAALEIGYHPVEAHELEPPADR